MESKNELNFNSSEDELHNNSIYKSLAHHNGEECVTGPTITIDKFIIWDVPEVRITLIFLYSLVYFICIFGNLAVIIVASVHWRMKSITNFFLGNLALADLCVGLFCVYQNMCFILGKNWIFGTFSCKMYYFVNEMAHTASIFLLVVMCIERYIVIIHPLNCKGWLTYKRLRLTTFAVWTLSGIYSLPKLYYAEAKFHNYDSEDEETKEIICTLNQTKYNAKIFDHINMGILFFLPLILMTVLYSIVGYTLWNSCNSVFESGQNGNEREQKHKNTENSLQTQNFLSIEKLKIHCEKSKHKLKAKEHVPFFRSRKNPNNYDLELIKLDNLNSSNCTNIIQQKNELDSSSKSNFTIMNGFKIEKSESTDMDERKLNDELAATEFVSDFRPSPNVGNDNDNDNNTPNLAIGTIQLQNLKTFSLESLDSIGIPTVPSPDSETITTSKYHCPTVTGQRRNCCTKPKPKLLTKSSNKILQTRRNVVKMLIIIVLNFAICNLPYHSRKLWQIYGSSYNGSSTFSKLFTASTFILMYAASSINPILYAFYSKKFRQCLVDVVKCNFRRSK